MLPCSYIKNKIGRGGHGIGCDPVALDEIIVYHFPFQVNVHETEGVVVRIVKSVVNFFMDIGLREKRW